MELPCQSYQLHSALSEIVSLVCLQRFFFVCSVSFLFAAFLFCLQGFFFVCSVSFLFAVLCPLWAIVEERLFNQRQYHKEKIANESADNRQERLANQHQYQNEKNVHNPSITDEIRKFHANVSRGPEYICSCCNQLWYKHSVITAEKLRLSNPTAGKYLLTKTSVNGIEWICQSCYKHLKKDKIPPCVAKNGMSFPAKPDFFYLNELECRMLAPRLAFQKLLQAPRRNQFKVKGHLVNVPADVNSTVNMLPRLPQESRTVQVKRRLKYKSSALCLNVRHNKILQAANWLATNSMLYREHGISFSTDRAASYSTNLLQNEGKSGHVSQPNEQISGGEDTYQLDDRTEDDVEMPAGETDTMLSATDFLEDSERA